MKFKNSLLMRSVVYFLVLGLPTQSLAQSKGIFLPLSSAKKVAVELKYCQGNSDFLTAKYGICNDERSNLLQQKDILTQENLGLKKDKALLSTSTEEYKKNLLDTNDKFVKCEESKPSRLTWFGIGAVSTMVLSVVMMFLIKK